MNVLVKSLGIYSQKHIKDDGNMLVKSFAADTAKQLWRQKIVEFSRKHLDRKQRKKARALCLPGAEMREVFEVYDKLGLRRRNVVGIEFDSMQLDKIKELNDSLEERIWLPDTNVSMNEYIVSSNKKFDIVSFDYCGYFDEDKIDDISVLAASGILADNFVLVTNYQQAREDEKTQNLLRHMSWMRNCDVDLDTIPVSAAYNFLQDTADMVDDETKLSVLRTEYCQLLPVICLNVRTGFWNSPAFIEQAKIFAQGFEDPEEEISIFNELRRKWDIGINTAEAILVYQNIGSTLNELAQSVFCMLVESQTRRWGVVDHAAYKYISDSNTPMISDMYFFKKNTVKSAESLARRCRYNFEKEGIRFDFRGSDKALSVLVDQFYQERVTHEENFDLFVESLPLEREFLKASYNLVLKKTKKNSAKIHIDDETKKLIVIDIQSGRSEDDILSEYKITKPQLRAYKAHITMGTYENEDNAA